MNKIFHSRIARTYLPALIIAFVSACEPSVEVEPDAVAAGDPGQVGPPATDIVFARAVIEPTAGNTAKGAILFSESSGRVNISGELSGLAPGLHGLHIHEQGDCSAPDASSAGGHFEPGDDPHGSPLSGPEDHHVGDLGNVSANVLGAATIDSFDTEMTLDAGIASITGRAVIVHAESDDFADQPAGDAGTRVGCGVIVALTTPDTSL
jgi:Cu-Zn family superoxide dismutase